MASPKTSSSDWSKLPDDILVSILERLPFVDDLRFRAVCPSWRSAAKRRPGPPKPPSPWLLFCDLYAGRIMGGDEACAFLSFPDGNKYSIRLPNVRYRYCIGSSDGWLVVVGDDGELCLLNPISRAVIALPRSVLKPDEAGNYLGGAALFVGNYFSSFCVKGSPEFRRNCIYVSGLGLGHSVGVFDMESGKMEICHVNDEGKNWWEWSTIWFMPSLL